MKRPTHDHAAIRAQATSIRNSLAENDRGAVLEKLNDLYVMLDQHFQEEESPNGFFQEAEQLAPRLVPAVRALCEQHEAILKTLSELMSETEEPGDTFPDDVLRLLETLSQHEQAEDNLIDEAYYYDLGATCGGP